MIKLYFFNSVCKSGGGVDRDSSPTSGICQKVKIGEGVVTKILNDHYSLVKTNSKIAISEGDIVEKY